MALTEMAIRNAKPCDRIYRLTDSEGMFLQVHPNGKKYWRMHYRFEGKQKTLAFGTYPMVSMVEARLKRANAKLALSEGRDPGEEKRARKKTLKNPEGATFGEIFNEWLTKRQAVLSQRHRDYLQAQVERTLIPDLGHRPMAKIKPADLLECLVKMEKRGAVYTAHRMRQIAGQIFRYGITRDACENDIAASLRGALASHAKGNFASIPEKELPNLCQAISGYHETGDMVTALGLPAYLPGSGYVIRELVNGEIPPAGIVIPGDTSVPTATSGDRRGTYTPAPRVLLDGRSAIHLLVSLPNPGNIGAPDFFES